MLNLYKTSDVVLGSWSWSWSCECLGLGLAQWSCLHVIEANSDGVSNRSTDAHRDL